MRRVAFLLLALLSLGCRAGENEACKKSTDCDRGLECADDSTCQAYATVVARAREQLRRRTEEAQARAREDEVLRMEKMRERQRVNREKQVVDLQRKLSEIDADDDQIQKLREQIEAAKKKK